MAANSTAGAIPRNSAIKDAQLTYRACTLGYAESLQLASPSQLVGQTDFDFLSDRGASLVHAAEQRVLESGTTEITAGALLSKRTAGKFFVRSPVFNRAGQICGVEISVVSVDDLHRSYQLLLGPELQLRDVINQSPFGLLIHRNYELIYVNASWLALLGSAETLPGAEEIRKLVPSGNDDIKIIHSLNSTGTEQELRLQSRDVRWNGSTASAVYCVPGVPVTSAFSTIAPVAGEDAGFIEKRHGHRRSVELAESGSLLQQSRGHQYQGPDEQFFKELKQPILICDNWVPIHVNSAAQAMLTKDASSNYQSISSWFSDRDRASIEAINTDPDKINDTVSARLHRKGKNFLAFVSTTHWNGKDLMYLSLQPQIDMQSELEQTVARYSDYVAAAGDFSWEMDSENRLTHISVEMKELLGIESDQLLNVPLHTLIAGHVHEEDQAEWKVLLVDMNKNLPFRDREYIWRHKNGDKRALRLSGVPAFDSEDQYIGYRGVGWDCTARHHNASIVAYHASHDSLTGLVNRREFELRCNDAITRTDKANQALCFIDLDNFKRVNDTAGHLAGDELLRQLSALFTSLVRKSDVLARLGGDEFGLLIYNVGIKEAMRLASQLRAEVESFQFHWEGRVFSVGASIGLVMIDTRWSTRSALFGAADAACYEAKHKGRNRVAVFTDDHATEDHKQGEPHRDEYIRSAVEQRNIKLAMQRIAAPDDLGGSSSKIEVLMRLPSPEGELLLPGSVLPLVERFGLSVKLDKAIVELTIDWLEGQPHVTDGLDLCCVNLSGTSIIDEGFQRFLLRALRQTNVDPAVMCFEVSESAISTNLTVISRFMEELGALGCRFAMDDFSGAISSFNYLKKLPVSFVKINSTYVRAIMDDPVHYTMVRSINDVAQTLGKQTIAESVESADVLEKLRELGVNLVQGYHISAPEMIDF